MKNARRLKEEAVEALRAAAVAAIAKCRDYVTDDQERLAEIYAGRDGGGVLFFAQPPEGGVPVDQWVNELKSGAVNTGSMTANLLTSRLVQIFVSSTPGRPQFVVEPRTPGALMAAETQECVSDVTLSGSRLDDAVRRAAWLDPIQNYVGVRLCMNPHSRDATDKVKWEVIEAKECGYEPYSRRFTWHARVAQWGSLDDALRKAILKNVEHDEEPNPWDPVALTEVFDERFALENGDEARKGCRVHVFANLRGKFYKDPRQVKPNLGDYVITYDVVQSPLVIEANMEPGPLEDVAPVEAVNWMGLLNAITDCVEQIRREVAATNNINVYDADNIQQELLKKVMMAPPGTQVFLPVTGVGSMPQGINSRLRPIERNSILGELITSLQSFLALLDDATGVGPQDRGVSINPSKSATEAATLSASSSRRTAARLRTQMRRWERCLRVLFEWQREIYGEYLEVPIEGVIRKYRVPDPSTTRYAFTVALDEMENLSRRGRIDTQMMAHQLIVNHAVAFAQIGESILAAESMRRSLKALGWKDADAYTTARRVLGSPEDRYTKMLETGRDFPVDENDDPTRFIAFLGAKLQEAVATGNENIPVDRLEPAIQRYQVMLRQKEAAQVTAGRSNVVPGVNAQGEMDNQISQQMQMGLPPQMSPQMFQ